MAADRNSRYVRVYWPNAKVVVASCTSARGNQVDEFMIKLKSRNFCVGCNKNEGDRNSGAWGCKSCRTWVTEEFFAQEGHLTM
jgi:ribosomal protein L37AE/L43A